MDLIDFIKPILTMSLIGALYAGSRLLYKPAKMDRLGWSWLKPAPLHYLALYGALAFSLLMWWVYFFVGSARSDAASQEFMMMVLASLSGVGAIYVWWACFAKRYSWKGCYFRITCLGKEEIHNFEQLVDVELLEVRDEVRLVFADGSCLTLSPDLHGADELAEHIGNFAP